MSLRANQHTIRLIEASERGLDGGILVEDAAGQPLGHWPMGMTEAVHRAQTQFPDALIIYQWEGPYEASEATDQDRHGRDPEPRRGPGLGADS